MSKARHREHCRDGAHGATRVRRSSFPRRVDRARALERVAQRRAGAGRADTPTPKLLDERRRLARSAERRARGDARPGSRTACRGDSDESGCASRSSTSHSASAGSPRACRRDRRSRSPRGTRTLRSARSELWRVVVRRTARAAAARAPDSRRRAAARLARKSCGECGRGDCPCAPMRSVAESRSSRAGVASPRSSKSSASHPFGTRCALCGSQLGERRELIAHVRLGGEQHRIRTRRHRRSHARSSRSVLTYSNGHSVHSSR